MVKWMKRGPIGCCTTTIYKLKPWGKTKKRETNMQTPFEEGEDEEEEQAHRSSSVRLAAAAATAMLLAGCLQANWSRVRRGDSHRLTSDLTRAPLRTRSSFSLSRLLFFASGLHFSPLTLVTVCVCVCVWVYRENRFIACDQFFSLFYQNAKGSDLWYAKEREREKRSPLAQCSSLSSQSCASQYQQLFSVVTKATWVDRRFALHFTHHPAHSH